MWNAFLDNTKMSLSDMYEVVGNSPFVRNGKIEFKKFWALKVNAPNSIRRLELWTKDFAPLNYMQVMTEFGQQRSWVNQYLLGWQWRAERVSGWVDLILNQYKSKLTPITDSINMMMWNMARSWVLMFLKYFSRAELLKKKISIVDIMDEGWKNIISFSVNGKDVRDIIDEDNITFTFDALYKVEQENRRAALKENLQYLLQYTQDKVNLPELMKATLWMDFEIDNIFKDQSYKESYVSQKLLDEEVAAKKAKSEAYNNNQSYNWGQWGYKSYWNKQEFVPDEASDYKKQSQYWEEEQAQTVDETQLTEEDLSALDNII